MIFIGKLNVKNNLDVSEIILYPRSMADKVFNPILRYLDEQFSEIVPREALATYVTRD